MGSDSSRRGPTEASRTHAIAQRLVYEQFGDWRYDPGNPSFDSWRRRAKRVLKHLREHEKEASRAQS